MGAELCAACHPDRAESVGKTKHGWALAEPSRPPAERGCEACHGPGSAHVQAGGGKGVGNLQNFAPSRSAAERSAVCLKCHAGDPSRHAFRNSAHVLAGIACSDCHSPHDFRADPLLRGSVPQLCYGCHLEKQAQFALPEHHWVNEGVVSCLDCHNPHGTRNPRLLLATNNRQCFRCHADKQGPFVFEHPAVFLEGCVRCHDPHGSVNRHLLKYQQVAQLCYECHTVTPQNHMQPSFRDCTRCHVGIHGSNVSPRFLEQ
jgi:DmsE family decaheme c-type cytochrome